MGAMTLNRRAILTAMAVAPVAAVPAPTAAYSVAASPWQTALAAFRQAHNDYASFNRVVVDPASAALEQAWAKVPHRVFEYENGARVTLSLTTDRNADVALAKDVIRSFPHSDTSFSRACRDLIEADKARTAEWTRLCDVTGADAAEERDEQLYDVRHKAKLAAITAPARSLAELSDKIAFIGEQQMQGDTDSWDAIAADVRRLAGRA